jgi:hypothetical protein
VRRITAFIQAHLPASSAAEFHSSIILKITHSHDSRTQIVSLIAETKSSQQVNDEQNRQLCKLLKAVTGESWFPTRCGSCLVERVQLLEKKCRSLKRKHPLKKFTRQKIEKMMIKPKTPKTLRMIPNDPFAFIRPRNKFGNLTEAQRQELIDEEDFDEDILEELDRLLDKDDEEND